MNAADLCALAAPEGVQFAAVTTVAACDSRRPRAGAGADIDADTGAKGAPGAAPRRLLEDAHSVLEEVPVALVYNGIAHAVMLASPADLDDFAVGFSLSEGVIAHPRQLFDIEVSSSAAGIEVAMHIDGAAMARLKQSRIARTGKTGCGLCGIDSLAQFNAASPPVGPGPIVSVAALHRAMAALPGYQQLHQQTGACHAAAWADADGRLLLVREDVGRHNALDKLIGAHAGAGLAASAGFVLVTSRASYEMVQKAARHGIGLLAAVSAPTALAVRTAAQAGLTLAGFVRHGAHTVYTHPERLVEQGQVDRLAEQGRLAEQESEIP